MDRICIIGAGVCGTRAAFALREAGFAGDVMLVSAEAGLPYDRPPLSKPNAQGGFLTEIATADSLEKARITLLSGVTVTAIDRPNACIALSDGSSHTYDRLLLATGATPRSLSCDPQGHALMMRTKEDADRIYTRAQSASRAVIIGAGLIGLELAAELRRRDIAVTVVEMAPRALGRAVPDATADRIVARHRNAGVAFRFDAGIAGIAAGSVTLCGNETLPADLIVAAVGVIPDTALAESAGLACANGITVSATLATSDPRIFAAGDCANFDHPDLGQIRLESWRNAQDQGGWAAQAMLGADAPFRQTPWFWSDQYELGLQITGHPDPQNTATIRDLGQGATITFFSAPDGTLTAAVGLGPGNAVAKDIRLAEMMIARSSTPSPDDLADPSVTLKTLLRS